MAANDDLDDFFKKKDRKGNKHKKQTGLLTNNEELHKQLVIVTSATTAFKENMDFDEFDDEQHVHDDPIIGTGEIDDPYKIAPSQQHQQHHHHKTKTTDDNKHSNGQQTNVSDNNSGQQDEWEEFTDSNSRYEQLRLKFASAMNHDNDDEYYDDDNNPNNNDGDNNDRNFNREQNKDKPVWKTDQIKQQTATIPSNVDETESASASKSAATAAPTTSTKPASTGAYRPPQLRTGGSAVTVVSGVGQRTGKKEKPNIASTEEFPTLGATVNKK